MIRKLDLFLSNHSKFPAKQILMKKHHALKRDKEAKTKMEQTQLSEREIQELLYYYYLKAFISLLFRS